MLEKEDVDGWNNVFPDCPIKQCDLSKPTEGFLVRALVCYIRRFGLQVEPPFPLTGDVVENSRENRLFLISLVRQIDHFLKITDKSYSFNYFDLIRPSMCQVDGEAFVAPKKTAHTLYILLNYLFYYNMYKEEVFKIASVPIREFQELTAAIERLRRENGQKEQEAEDEQTALETLDHEISVIETENKDLCKRNETQEEEKKKLNEQRETLELTVRRLQEQKRTLNRDIVSDDEVLELQKQLDYEKEEFEKLKLNECTSMDKLRELEDSVNLLQQCIKEIEKASEIIPKRLLEQMLETSKQVEDAEKANRNADNRHVELLDSIEKETTTNDNLAEECQMKKEELRFNKHLHAQLMNELENQSVESNSETSTLGNNVYKLESQLTNQNALRSYIDENITEILGTYE